jgi:threonine synthase
MKYYSTNHKAPLAELSEVVTRGLAPDGGLYMPERIAALPEVFFNNFADMSFVEMSQRVARALFPDVNAEVMNRITAETLSFDTPLSQIDNNTYALELFHGPTLAFKDVGARFMARLLAHFAKSDGRKLNVLVATSGDTGSAVANGFLGVEGINVYVLYPKGKVSRVQESQFATLGQNITAIEINGTFDDCQRLVKQAFTDAELTSAMRLTSANSINIARFMPQSFYYFNAVAQLRRKGIEDNIVVCVPSGNFGNITAGLVAKRMGLGISRFIAANNANDVFLEYLNTGKYTPRPSVQTYANAMDVGAPSNFARILELYNNSHDQIAAEISGFRVDDNEILETIDSVYSNTGYIVDPHGACAYRALKALIHEGETGIFLETAHPAKFGDVIQKAIGREAEMPERLSDFLKGRKQSAPLGNGFEEFKTFLMQRKDI